MRKPSPDNYFTPQEIATILNNASRATLHPKLKSLGSTGKEEIAPGIPEKRLRKLRELALCDLQIWYRLVEEDVVRPEEVVAILTCAALMAQVTLVQKRSLQGDTVDIGGQRVSIKKAWGDDISLGLSEDEESSIDGKVSRKWDRLRKKGFKGEKLLEAAEVFDE